MLRNAKMPSRRSGRNRDPERHLRHFALGSGIGVFMAISLHEVHGIDDAIWTARQFGKRKTVSLSLELYVSVPKPRSIGCRGDILVVAYVIRSSTPYNLN